MPTANGTPASEWSLVLNADTSDMRGGIGSRFHNIEWATTSTASAPADSLEGHFVAAGRTEPCTLSRGHRLWWRVARNTASETATGVYTFEEA